jgi:hypothetical protein
MLLAVLVLLPSSTLSAEAQREIVAYYFHTSIRCRTCLLIEERTEDILRYEFADLFKSGDMQWRAVNVQLPENRHFLADLYVSPKSLVLVEYRDGSPLKRTILPKVWQLVYEDDPNLFDRYVADTTRTFMEEKLPPP